ncbi:hypothetical protein BN79_124 [Yersinia phage phiR2-01]|uniref:Uncharacterized protein n=1 Tax=Yersinia phage phiR2-01 TaxID=1206557 RepID=I7J3U5_9CAUD|nr:hypothetical protein BN79_124 [Yersinia phage phiR2-01]CCI88533.1 hypothetical protein BN79_124 [Yersinia phage phiR2-01]
MNKTDIIAQCNKHGEFYLHYEKLRQKGTTYLQGTMEFDPAQDKYLAERIKRERIRQPKEDEILVFSRTNDSFRFIPVAKVRRITSLQDELKRASPVGK